MVRQAELIRQAQDGDKKARDKVVSDNLGLVHAIVRRFEKRGHDREELFQIGCIGLIKAIDHFDLSLNLAFSTYAVPMITGEIRRFLRDDGMVKVSRSLKENGYKISRAKEVLTTELGRDPSLLELSAMTELGTEEIVMALDANRGWSPFPSRSAAQTEMNFYSLTRLEIRAMSMRSRRRRLF